ncbi:uncharacterized protein DSM5745_10673 [Aspergillus mulundensis]|uniref:Uncharacterized protein n=1 Tax=Aspergillus mulundensis TaxID=1810919 RepID=A0A3D8QH94_9EURO|nr:hypothetical protein DSM5745_10673 [Aspergillus mulundensis]RDW61175.1 hypothetical protein DSM5745_10673 [Aspergillus mulundensis]
MSDPQLETATESNPRVVTPEDERHSSQPSPKSPSPDTPRRRPPKLRRRQQQPTGERDLPPDTARQPTESSQAVQQPERQHSSVTDADDEHEHGNNTFSSSEPTLSEDTSSLSTSPTPALEPGQAQNSRQRMVLDRSDEGPGGQSQRITRIHGFGDTGGEMVRNIRRQGRAVGTVGRAPGDVTDVTGRSVGGREVQERPKSRNEQLRLRLDLNLDLEVQLKAKIRGDLTLQLMYVLDFFFHPETSVHDTLCMQEVILTVLSIGVESYDC